MDTIDATMIIEGVVPERYYGQVVDAWQLLIDTGLAWQLQGCYGRTAQALIEKGICNAPERAEEYDGER